ncbi:MAG: Appr-1-p processing protein [Chitinophaga sp.]|nr:Appr-1-p processing protein [Chitinophaga sp.]
MNDNSIIYLKGDATRPAINGNKIIAHICNDIGRWGKGFVLAVSKRWTTPEKEYKAWFKSQQNFALGQTQFVQVEPDIWIANIIGQHKIIKDEQGNPPIRYDAVRAGLQKVAAFAIEINATIHMPRIGCGLAGGTWDKIAPIITAEMSNRSEVYVYDF